MKQKSTSETINNCKLEYSDTGLIRQIFLLTLAKFKMWRKINRWKIARGKYAGKISPGKTFLAKNFTGKSFEPAIDNILKGQFHLSKSDKEIEISFS